MTSSTGTVTASYDYDAYGNPTVLSGSLSATPFGFAGAYSDTESGLLYLINRYYDPTTGQFLSVDPDVAQTGQPYGYVGEDPMNEVDPLGLMCFSLHCIVNDAVSAVTAPDRAAIAAGKWVYHHPVEAAGLVLGVVALATGVGAVFGGLEIAAIGVDLSATAAGIVSVGAGALGAAADRPGCDAGDSIACLGLGLNLTGAAMGGLGIGAAAAGSDAVSSLLQGASLTTGGAGLTLDFTDALINAHRANG